MEKLVAYFGARLASKGWMLVTAESCTGGLVAKLVTDVPGSSSWFDRGFITYSNESKIQMLGVSDSTIRDFGAVSEQTVVEMASGALAKSNSQCAVAISGIAGPGGGTVEKPVGTVCFAWKVMGILCVPETCHFSGDRESIRQAAALYALRKFGELI